MRQNLQSALAAAQTLSRDELPALVGALEEIRCIALARLTTPLARETEPDELLDVGEASSRLGVSANYLYHNHSHFSFTRRIGRSLRFSAAGIEDYIRQGNGLTARRQRAILPAGGGHERTIGKARQ